MQGNNTRDISWSDPARCFDLTFRISSSSLTQQGKNISFVDEL